MVGTLQKKIKRESKDYLAITFGLVCYAIGWVAFLLPYQITTGGVSGIAAIIYYATGVEMQYSYFIINAVFLGFALKILGPKFSLKTVYAIFMLTFLLWFFQLLMKDEGGNLPQLLGSGQDFMACVIGAGMLGFGIGIVFSNNGSTGGTDIIAWIINKYRDITLGRMMMYCDIIIISSCYFIFHDWKRVLFGFCVLFIMSIVIDYVVNSSASLARDVEPIEGTQFCSSETGFSVIAADKDELCLHMMDKNGKVLYTVKRNK